MVNLELNSVGFSSLSISTKLSYLSDAIIYKKSFMHSFSKGNFISTSSCPFYVKASTDSWTIFINLKLKYYNKIIL